MLVVYNEMHLRAGFDDDRSVSVAVSLGVVSHHQVGLEDAHAARPARQHSFFHHVSDGKLDDVKILDVPVLEVGAIYAMGRGYLDFTRLYLMHQARTFSVTRAKSNTKLRRIYSAPVDRSTCVICDQNVALTGTTSRKEYPDHLRRIRFKDPETGKTLIFLTNNFALPAVTICALYKSRWQVELFFKWIKRHLRIKKNLRHVRECGEVANLDRRVGLYSLGHRQKTPQSRHFATDIFTDSFRENAHPASFRGKQLQSRARNHHQPIDSVRVLTGQQWYSTRTYYHPKS